MCFFMLGLYRKRPCTSGVQAAVLRGVRHSLRVGAALLAQAKKLTFGPRISIVWPSSSLATAWDILPWG